MSVLENIQTQDIARTLGDRYLSYALSTIMHRALPDVRDGLKPVHRRLLYAMQLLKLNPETGFKKCARIVGDVIGKYHPHGDQAVYEALVRLAQDFSVRYPLIDGQGNFGNIDGDNPAAMRYTEARLTPIAQRMMRDLEEGIVDFVGNYDDTEQEPAILPAAFPNILANGAYGIAVGMATSIPPHNLDELCAALLHLIENRQASVRDLMAFVKGPDFPTGGILIDDWENIVTVYESGKGSLRLRCSWHKEHTLRGGYVIIVDELPYQVQKSRLIERIASLIEQKSVPLLADVRDESDEKVRLVLEPKNRSVDPQILMQTLYKSCDLETRFSVNMNVLNEHHVPGVMNLAQILTSFLQFRQQILLARSRRRLAQVEQRLHLLEGFLLIYLNLDEVIRIIRHEDHPKSVLMQTFSLSEAQTEAVLNIRLRALAKLEEIAIRREHEALRQEQAALQSLLADEGQQWQAISQEIQDIRDRFGSNGLGGKRLTKWQLAQDVELPDPQELLTEKEPVTVICSEKYWMRTAKGHIALNSELKFKDGDKGFLSFHAQSHDKLLVFSSDGRTFTLPCSSLPGGRSMGEPLRLMIELPEIEKAVVTILPYQEAGRVLLMSSEGRGFILPMAQALAQTRNGKQVMSCVSDVRLMRVRPILPEHDHIAVIGSNHRLLIFPIEELPEMTRGKGVLLQKYRSNERILDIAPFRFTDGLPLPDGRKLRKDLSHWQGKRHSTGRNLPASFSIARGGRIFI